MEILKNSQEKPKSVEALIGEAPDAVVVISGALKYNDKKGRHEMGSFSDVDDSGLVAGGKERVIAAVEVHKHFPESILIATSQHTDPTMPTYASVIAAELIRMGVPAEKIIEENQSYRTIDGLKNTLLLCRKNGWRKVLFLTSGYHIPRVNEMLEHISEFSQDEKERAQLTEIVDAMRKKEFVVQTVSVDAVLPFRSQHYETYLNAVKKTPGYHARVALEEKDVQDIRDGRYVFTAPRKKVLDSPDQR